MSGAAAGHKEPEPLLVEDPKTGDRFLMYPLRLAAWPCAPRYVYECPTCCERFPPEEWAGCCPGCSGRGRRKKRRRRDCDCD
jgi:hypothetical protein